MREGENGRRERVGRKERKSDRQNQRETDLEEEQW